MKISVITIFPEAFEGIFAVGMIRRAIQKGLLELEVLDLRDFTRDRHRTVDDRPYGGGDGMVMKPEPIFDAVESCLDKESSSTRIILLSPAGRRLDQQVAQHFVDYDHLILICGRYEGVDQRIADHLADEEVSVGDYVLSGGEIGAMAIVDSVTRLLPGVVGNAGSVLDESFMHGLLDYPHYTRPAEFRGWKVPEILLSGDHDRVQKWRQDQAFKRTRQRRPDLLENE